MKTQNLNKERQNLFKLESGNQVLTDGPAGGGTDEHSNGKINTSIPHNYHVVGSYEIKALPLLQTHSANYFLWYV